MCGRTFRQLGEEFCNHYRPAMALGPRACITRNSFIADWDSFFLITTNECSSLGQRQWWNTSPRPSSSGCNFAVEMILWKHADSARRAAATKHFPDMFQCFILEIPCTPCARRQSAANDLYAPFKCASARKISQQSVLRSRRLPEPAKLFPIAAVHVQHF